MKPASIDSGTLAKTNAAPPGVIRGDEVTSSDALESAKREVAFDIGQMILDITGIFDPTPVSDGAGMLVSLARGNWFDAAASAVSMLPYLGDLAKTTKLPRYLNTIRKAIRIADVDPKWALALRDLFWKLKKVLDKAYDMAAGKLPV